MSKASKGSKGSRGSRSRSQSLDSNQEDPATAALPWRSYVVRLEANGATAKQSVDAALAALPSKADQDANRTRLEVVTKKELSGKLGKALAAKILRDRREGLRARLDAEAARLRTLKKARKEREKREARGDVLDDDSLSSLNPVAAEHGNSGAPDVIYVLRDFPSTKDEAAELVQHGGADPNPLLDCVCTVVQNEDGAGGGGVVHPRDGPVQAFDFLPLADLDHDEDVADATQHVPLEATKVNAARRRAQCRQTITGETPPSIVKALYDAQAEKGDVWGDVAFVEVALEPQAAVRSPNSPRSGGDSFDDHKVREARAAAAAAAAARAWLFDLTNQLTAHGASHCAFKSYVRGVDVVDVVQEEKATIASAAQACDAARMHTRDVFYGKAANGMPSSRPSTASSFSMKGRTPTPWESNGRRQRYAELASNIPPGAGTVGILLYCMLEAVVTGGDAMRGDQDPPAASPLAALLPHASSVLPIATTPAIAEAMLSGAFDATDLIYDGNDRNALAIAKAEQRHSEGGSLGSRLLLALDRAAHSKMQRPRLVGGRDGLPVQDITGDDGRAILRTELQAFTSFSPFEVDAFRQRCVFEALVAEAFEAETVDGALASIHDRTVSERISPHALVQVLQAETSNEARILKKYYAPTDELLLVAHHPTARGRCGQSAWDPRLGGRPSYADWHAGAARTDERIELNGAVTPRTASARHARVLYKGDSLETHTTLLFPADHAVVRLRTQGEAHAWLSVRGGGAVFGLRARDDGKNAARRAKGLPTQPVDENGFAADFVSEFADGQRVTAMKTGASVVLRTTGVSGLTVDVGTDGIVRQRHVGVGAPSPEKERVVCGGGIVVRRLRDGSAELLCANGSVAVKPCAELGSRPASRRSASKDDLSADDLEWTRMEGACIRDAATGARVWVRGESSLTIFADGVVLAVHHDGTEIRSFEQHVIVEAPGFAAVEVDREIDATAMLHAQRHQVAVAKGGQRMRVRVALPDGTRVVGTYDTSVTASIRGRLALLRTDRTEILARDDGFVTLRPPALYGGGSVKARGEPRPYGSLAPWCENENEEDDEAKSEPDTTSGAYEFDCINGKLSLEDPEFNRFVAHLCGREAGDTEVELAGVAAGIRAEAVVNSPVAPRCFAIARDGSAIELLRDSDVEALRSDVEARKVLPAAFGRAMASFSSNDHRGDDEDRAGSLRVEGTPYEILSTIPARADDRAALSLFERTFGTGMDWRARPTPPSAFAGPPQPPSSSIRPRIRVSRVLVETPPLAPESRDLISDALIACAEFRRKRELTIDRFAVEDPRSAAMIQNERGVQKRLKLAYKAARAARKRRRKKREEEKRLSRESWPSTAFSEATSEAPTATDTMTLGGFSSEEEVELPPDSPATVFAKEVFVGQVLEAMEEADEAQRLYELENPSIACAPAPAPAPAPSIDELTAASDEFTEDIATVEAPPPFDPVQSSLEVPRCRVALVEILGRNVWENLIEDKLRGDMRDRDQITFGDFRWLLIQFSNDFDAAAQAEVEAAKQRALDFKERQRQAALDAQARARERGPGMPGMGTFWDTEDGKELMATLPPYEGRKKTREDMRKASTDPTPVSKLAQQLEAEMYARQNAADELDGVRAPPPTEEEPGTFPPDSPLPAGTAPPPTEEKPGDFPPDSPLPAGTAMQYVRKTRRREPPPLQVEPRVVEVPAALGAHYEIPLAITMMPGGKVRIEVSSKNLKVLKRPRASLDPGETVEAVLEYNASSVGPIKEFVDILWQGGTVRIPIVGWVDASGGGE